MEEKGGGGKNGKRNGRSKETALRYTWEFIHRAQEVKHSWADRLSDNRATLEGSPKEEKGEWKVILWEIKNK